MEKPVVIKSTVNYNQPSLPSLLTSYGFGDEADEEKRKASVITIFKENKGILKL